ncbi:MAG: class I tRNA ligase family protein, partial [Planctomycetes bacterium]|nr:class I tRNA ligase family protein [Planctomycetota bacterium]
ATSSYDELCAKPGLQGLDVWEKAKAADPELCEDLKVHKPYIDEVSYQSPTDPAGRMRRVPEVIDCWFDSGCMPFAQWGYPHRNQERFRQQFPADFISEALDQTRGWFYSLLAISTMLFGENGRAGTTGHGSDVTGLREGWPQPFANCIVLGLIKGEDGLKMSKSKRNYKTPDVIFDHQGSDAMRWLLFSGSPPWTSLLFQDKAISDGQREFLIKLHNCYSFFVTYANIDGWKPRGSFAEWPDLGDGASELDRWLISELSQTVADVTASMDGYDSFGAARRLNQFVDSLSNWYLRRSRARYWTSGMSADKDAAYTTLYHALVKTALLAAPFIPYMTETLYQNLVRTRDDAEKTPLSVHLGHYPVFDPSRIDRKLAEEVAVVREIASLGHAVRAAESIKVKQPLGLAEIVLADAAHCEALAAHRGVIADELNVEEVAFTANAEEYVSYEVKPNFRSLGPKFGKRAPAIQKALRDLENPAALWQSIQEDGAALLTVDGESVELTSDDVQVALEAKEGWAASQGKQAVVVLRTEITPELKRKGLARELQRHIQTLRKDLDLAYDQRIELSVVGGGDWPALVGEFAAAIQDETLATRLDTAPLDPTDDAVTEREVEIEGDRLSLRLRPSPPDRHVQNA